MQRGRGDCTQRMQQQGSAPAKPRRGASAKRTGEWLPLLEAASVLGVSIDTMRRRIKRGEVEAQQVPTPKGPAWRVLVDVPKPAEPPASPTSPVSTSTPE